MPTVTTITTALDQLYQLDRQEPDLAMQRFVPSVYEDINADWRHLFTPTFCERFNGLMIRGEEQVGQVFAAAFPSTDILSTWFAVAQPGDLLVTHHPIDCRNGDPRGKWGEGFVPIADGHLQIIKDLHLSIYACHLPMDIAEAVGTTAAIVEALQGTVEAQFWPSGTGFAGQICQIAGLSTDDLAQRLLEIFGVPYLEREGANREQIERVAVIAGIGDHVDAMREVEHLGAQAYITGELHVRIKGEYGRTKYAQVAAFAQETTMSLLGIFHAASEHLVMETQLARWFTQQFTLNVVPLRESQWWR